MQTIQETISELRKTLKSYIEATYHISDPTLIRLREELLEEDGGIFREPYLESTPRYKLGEPFSSIKKLPPAALTSYSVISEAKGDLPKLIYDPPYDHQSNSIKKILVDNENIIIMTGTGSGKTEAFLLPILGKLAKEAQESPASFTGYDSMRALILYPMNALVNDQLGRLRSIFGDERIKELFKDWAGRPPRFARYTSRTPYPGVRDRKKDSARLKAFEDFFVDIENKIKNADEEQEEAEKLLKILKNHGKWPAKPDIGNWLGRKGSAWQKNGKFQRAITCLDDSELLTRHEVQNNPPDILVTNYSMLEYMLIRPIERTIFDKTRSWLEENPDEKFLIVLDEAHLYRGAGGTEVALLLRRFRDRLGITENRLQVICATASFSDPDKAKKFGSQLSGVPESSFFPITGNLDLKDSSSAGTKKEADVLSRVDLSKLYGANEYQDKLNVVEEFLDYRKIPEKNNIEYLLHEALKDFSPMSRLINLTMEEATPINELGKEIFPDVDEYTANKAVTALMTLGSIAKTEQKGASLLPCRIHNFFRGLPGLWVCMDPNCSKLSEEHRNGICGKMYSQPREVCKCGARVLELFTCRNCGSAYARAYTDNIDNPVNLWSEAGQNIHLDGEPSKPIFPIDLLLHSISPEDIQMDEKKNKNIVEKANYDIETGLMNPKVLGSKAREVYIYKKRFDGDSKEVVEPEARGRFRQCAICKKKDYSNFTYIHNHTTKGDKPFQALLACQLKIQPPGKEEVTPFAPLQGRKSLVFSDSRQVAARLAPNLEMYSNRDALRTLVMWGYKRLNEVEKVKHRLNLGDLPLATMIAAKALGVRLRPNLNDGEVFHAPDIIDKEIKSQNIEDDSTLEDLYYQLRTLQLPKSLLNDIIYTVSDHFLGLESLALASIIEREKHTEELENLPDIMGIAETNEEKIELARAWVRCWGNYGFWLDHMPDDWSRRERDVGVSVRTRPPNRKFSALSHVIPDSQSLQYFYETWQLKLIDIFTSQTEKGHRLRGEELTLMLDGKWVYCDSCKSVHRPFSRVKNCLDCGSEKIKEVNPDGNDVFLARKGFYRTPTSEFLSSKVTTLPIALTAGEHTAQLGSAQNEKVFSKAEENELLFQDIEFSTRQTSKYTAIDVLSSTTTMEVGIDIGALSGVALRNMPPSRANYQQRAGRAGRRGNAVATVISFGGFDTHDEHYFLNPSKMIKGEVDDPILTLDNIDITCRHIRAFLLQNYHQEKLPFVDDDMPHDLFSTLGSVSDFRSTDSALNLEDFKNWIDKSEKEMQERIAGWLPHEIKGKDREFLLNNMKADIVNELENIVDESAIESGSSTQQDLDAVEVVSETGEEKANRISKIDGLLDRLLYHGILPRYAFPTDVATFHVFDLGKSDSFRPAMLFEPSQGLPVALTQYAPGKQVWIDGKCYTSGALYSPMQGDMSSAWNNKKMYRECRNCGYADTYDYDEYKIDEIKNCTACGAFGTLGPAKIWLRPPGFAHPVDKKPVTSPDDMPEVSYATRAKLTKETPKKNEPNWSEINERIRAINSREHLLVSNSGPDKKGYDYCTSCGRIEANVTPNSESVVSRSHVKPFLIRGYQRKCERQSVENIVLGTKFITDIALFSMQLSPPFCLKPGSFEASIALRTVSEALAEAAANLLDIESSEIMAEYRPALTRNGPSGLEVEIFLYDTLAGGAGFSDSLIKQKRGKELFEEALNIMEICPEGCDSSCYRCLRSFRNRFEHNFLDRHIGIQLLKYLLTGKYHPFNEERMASSSNLLANDIRRQGIATVQQDSNIKINNQNITVPILATKESKHFFIALHSPIASNQKPDGVDETIMSAPNVLLINEIEVRRDLQSATRKCIEFIQDS